MASALLGAELRSWLTAAEVQRQCRRQLCRRAANQTQTAVPVTTRFLCKYRYFCTYAYFVVKDCIFVLLRLFTFICEQLATYDHVQGGSRKRDTGRHGRWKCLKVGGASSGQGHGERVEREPITRVWGRSPQRGPGAEPLVGLKAFWFLNVPRNGKTLRCLSRFDSV